MTDELSALQTQLDLVWRFMEDALANVRDEEALWVPTDDAWNVRKTADDFWVPDWADEEPEVVPASSIAWLQWHVMWWWSTVIDRSFGDGGLSRDDVVWVGAQESTSAIGELRLDWLSRLDGLTNEELTGNGLTRWPYDDGRPFLHVVAWVNAELMKNVAEMAYVRRISPHYRGSAPRT